MPRLDPRRGAQRVLRVDQARADPAADPAAPERQRLLVVTQVGERDVGQVAVELEQRERVERRHQDLLGAARVADHAGGRRDQRGHPADLERLDLDVDLQVERRQHVGEQRHGLAADPQLGALGGRQLLHPPGPAGEPLEQAVVEHHDVAVAVEPDVELDAVGAGGARPVEREHRVLGRVGGVAAVRPHPRPAPGAAPARGAAEPAEVRQQPGDRRLGHAASTLLDGRYSMNVLCSARTRLSTCCRSHHSVTRSGDTLTALSGTPAPTALGARPVDDAGVAADAVADHRHRALLAELDLRRRARCRGACGPRPSPGRRRS